MKQLMTLIGSDLRRIGRDRTLMGFLFFPVLVYGLARWGIPALTEAYPAIAPYHSMILMVAGMQSSILFGFIVAFLMIDEKDEQVMEVIRILPISPQFFLLYRLLFATFGAGAIALVVIVGAGIAYPGFWAALCISLLYGFTAPLITLIIATFAQNKIEAMALFKMVDLVLLLPVLSFFLEAPLRYLFGVVPVFWTYAFLERSAAGEWVWWYLGMAAILYTGVLWGLSEAFRRKVFQR